MNLYVYFCLFVASFVAFSTAEEAKLIPREFTFKKIFFVLLENQPLHVAMDDPAMSALATKGTLLTNLHAITNPSQPNYIGLISGDLMGVSTDDNYNVTGRCLVDLFEENDVSWKAYQENYPSQCFAENTPDGLYRRKHNPFISFEQVRDVPDVCAKIVNANQLYEDIESGSLPQYSFYTPNMNNNGHDTSMRYAAHWLEGFITPLLVNPKFMEDMLVVVTFDEGVPGDNIIYTVLFGNDGPAGHIDDTKYSLYSLLRLVEDQFSLPNLGRSDSNATQIQPAVFSRGKYVNTYRIIRIVVGVTVAIGAMTVAATIYFVYRKRTQIPGYVAFTNRGTKLKNSDYVIENA